MTFKSQEIVDLEKAARDLHASVRDLQASHLRLEKMIISFTQVAGNNIDAIQKRLDALEFIPVAPKRVK